MDQDPAVWAAPSACPPPRRPAAASPSTSRSRPFERVHADMERDRYFTGDEALAYGLVDRVIERRDLPGRARGFGQG